MHHLPLAIIGYKEKERVFDMDCVSIEAGIDCLNVPVDEVVIISSVKNKTDIDELIKVLSNIKNSF